MYTLFSTQGSGAASIEAALTLAGVEFRLVGAAAGEPGPDMDELLRVNPLGQVPTLLLPDGSVLTESAAILIHLGIEYPGSGLLPAGVAAQAQAIRGLVYIAANCYPAIGIIDFPERWCANADAETGERIRTGTRERLHYLWEIFADTFPARPFLTGEFLGAVDLLAAVVSKWSGARGHLATSRPAFSALLARIERDPRVAPIFTRHWPPAA